MEDLERELLLISKGDELPFTCLMKYILCLFHLLKCCIWQAVNTAHQYTFFCLIRILDIFQSILQVRCWISAL